MPYKNEDYGKPLPKEVVCQHCKELMPIDCEECPNCGRENTVGPYLKSLASQETLPLGNIWLMRSLKNQSKSCPHINQEYSDGSYYCKDCGKDMGSPWDC